jgi:hypothetical protein
LTRAGSPFFQIQPDFQSGVHAPRFSIRTRPKPMVRIDNHSRGAGVTAGALSFYFSFPLQNTDNKKTPQPLQARGSYFSFRLRSRALCPLRLGVRLPGRKFAGEVAVNGQTRIEAQHWLRRYS